MHFFQCDLYVDRISLFPSTFSRKYVLDLFVRTFEKWWLLCFTHSITRSYPYVKKIELGEVKPDDIYNLCIVSFVETATIYISPKRPHQSILLEFVYFIPDAFLFELVFDFFHYWTHRLAHNRYIYKYIHKRHHEYHADTTILATFHQDTVDLLLTNAFPMYMSSLLLPFSYPQYFVFFGKQNIH
jgi:sterol desaturase/sphingolipid hydroxylase (fatty acid hydroxylase superfamily)